jgi:hypothetical protein
MEQLVCSGGISAVPRNRILSEFQSDPFRRGENNSEFSPGNKNRRKHLEFCSKPFHGRETNSEFSSVEQKKANSSNCVPKHVSEEKKSVISVCWSRFFGKLMFFMQFRSISSFRIDSSVNLGMPRNEPFLLQNNRNHSESILRSESRSSDSDSDCSDSGSSSEEEEAKPIDEANIEMLKRLIKKLSVCQMMLNAENKSRKKSAKRKHLWD